MIAAAALLIATHIWFFTAIRKRRNDIADVAWGLGFILLGVVQVLAKGSYTNTRSLIVLALVIIWGARLSIYIGRRSRGSAEDPRYVEMREAWGERWLVNTYLKVFLLQGFLLYLIAQPMLAVLRLPASRLATIDFIAIGVAALGFVIEAVADYQKNKFKSRSSNRQKICDVGLWSQSRHPNYFGEILFWIGISLFSLVDPAALWWVWFGPVLLITLLLKVSGVPLIEKRYAGRSDYDEYKKRTNLLVPIRLSGTTA